MGTHTTAPKHTHGLLTSPLVLAAAILIPAAGLYAAPIASAKSAASVAAFAVPADQKPQQIVIPVLLDTPLDSKKQGSGAQVEAKTVQELKLNDGTVIPKGSTVIGHVTNAKAKGKGDSESVLAIEFDKVTSKDGKTANIEGHIRAVAPDPNSGKSGASGVDYGSSMNRTIAHPQSDSQPDVVPILSGDSVGVEGISHLGLDEQTGLLRTGDKAVKLAHNSQLLIQAKVVAGQ